MRLLGCRRCTFSYFWYTRPNSSPDCLLPPHMLASMGYCVGRNLCPFETQMSPLMNGYQSLSVPLTHFFFPTSLPFVSILPYPSLFPPQNFTEAGFDPGQRRKLWMFFLLTCLLVHSLCKIFLGLCTASSSSKIIPIFFKFANWLSRLWLLVS